MIGFNRHCLNGRLVRKIGSFLPVRGSGQTIRDAFSISKRLAVRMLIFVLCMVMGSDLIWMVTR